MGKFDKFLRCHPDPIRVERPTPEVVGSFRSRLPDALLQFWRDHGRGGFGDGVLWVVDPHQFDGILEDWLKDPGNAWVVARTSFGDLFLWRNGEVNYLDVHLGDLYVMMPSIEEFLNEFLCEEETMYQVLRRDLHRQAVATLGPLTEDEQYMFVPALAFGGTEDIGNVQKGKIREHLGFLAQLVLGSKQPDE